MKLNNFITIKLVIVCNKLVQFFCNFTRLQPMLSILQLNNDEHEQG
jgi:hypothetical protein